MPDVHSAALIAVMALVTMALAAALATEREAPARLVSLVPVWGLRLPMALRTPTSTTN